MKTLFTGDLHFGHTNALKFDPRPFKTIEEHDETLISLWNNKISTNDLVYVVGDMIWKPLGRTAAELVRELNGQIILIKGNHDKFCEDAKVKKYLASIKDKANIRVKTKDGKEHFCYLDHHLVPLYPTHRYGGVHIHAHSHTSQEYFDELEVVKFLNNKGYNLKVFNAGCMHWDYVPVTLDEMFAGKAEKGLSSLKHNSIL